MARCFDCNALVDAEYHGPHTVSCGYWDGRESERPADAPPSFTWSEGWEAALMAESSATELVVRGSSPCLACEADYDAHTCRPIDGDLVELQFADPRFR